MGSVFPLENRSVVLKQAEKGWYSEVPGVPSDREMCAGPRKKDTRHPDKTVSEPKGRPCGFVWSFCECLITPRIRFPLDYLESF